MTAPKSTVYNTAAMRRRRRMRSNSLAAGAVPRRGRDQLLRNPPPDLQGLEPEKAGDPGAQAVEQVRRVEEGEVEDRPERREVQDRPEKGERPPDNPPQGGVGSAQSGEHCPAPGAVGEDQAHVGHEERGKGERPRLEPPLSTEEGDRKDGQHGGQDAGALEQTETNGLAAKPM